MQRSRTFPLVLGLFGAASAACSPETRDFTASVGGSTATSSAVSSSGASVSGSSGAGGAGGSDSASVSASSGAGTPQNAGDCATDAECPGSTCVEVTPGGYRVCLDPPPEATQCNDSVADQCCDSTACRPPGRCYLADERGCGGPLMLPHNECMIDQCQVDADCQALGAMAICVEAGVFGRPVRSCVDAFCRRDADCTQESGGICAPVPDFCCGVVRMACVYPSDGCRSTGDCDNQYCVIQSGRARCVDTRPICPR